MRQVGPGGGSTFGSQATFVLPWNDTMAVAMLDRWRAAGLQRSFVRPLIRFIPDSLKYSAPLSLRRQRDRTQARAQ
jgi:hypothetical protein